MDEQRQGWSPNPPGTGPQDVTRVDIPMSTVPPGPPSLPPPPLPPPPPGSGGGPSSGGGQNAALIGVVVVLALLVVGAGVALALQSRSDDEASPVSAPAAGASSDAPKVPAPDDTTTSTTTTSTTTTSTTTTPPPPPTTAPPLPPPTTAPDPVGACGPPAGTWMVETYRTARFLVTICISTETDAVVYRGVNQQTGDRIDLPARFTDIGFAAENGDVLYYVNDEILAVYQGDELILEEAVIARG